MLTDLLRWNPADELRSIFDHLERRLSNWSRFAGESSWWPQMATEEDRLQLQVALPGLSREDVEITTVGRTLRIRASRKEGKSNFTDYEQQLLLPDYVDTDRVTATMRHGLLEISMPYKEALKPKRIEIASEAPEQKRLNAAA